MGDLRGIIARMEHDLKILHCIEILAKHLMGLDKPINKEDSVVAISNQETDSPLQEPPREVAALNIT